ncbi:hypothetical protein PybrP1_006600 [[Pythium] brassicae (nom. inval.)]|nr:hypothetical protein PybrP1_006600 [[Pythium] brassicae (nom. inval.)]
MLDKPPLPVPKGYFGALELSEDERAKIRDDVRAQLEITLADELAFVHLAKRQVDATQWRLVKRKRELRVFRRRAHAAVFTGDTAAPAEPSVLAVGRMEGAIEDLIFGAYSKSHDELKTTGQPADDGAAKMCVRCRGSAGYFSSLKPCGVCGAVVCSQCRDKKPVFVGTSHSVCVVPCCRPCVTEAKSLAVRPAESSFSILGEQYLPQDEFSGLESFGSPDEQSTSAGARRRGPGCGDGQGKMAALSDDLSELDVDQYRFSDDEDSGISEGDLEKWQSWSGGSSSSSAPTSNSEDPSSMTFTSESRAASGLEAAAATVAAAAATEAAVPAGAIAATSSLTPEQVAIYHKVLVLQSTADETYWAAQTSDECEPSVP